VGISLKTLLVEEIALTSTDFTVSFHVLSSIIKYVIISNHKSYSWISCLLLLMTNKTNTPKKKERISLQESAESLERFLRKPVKPFQDEDGRGVKVGTKRGQYRPREKGVIKDKNFITTICQQCKQEFTYKRKGKRLKKYCSDKCKQKHYRKVKIQKKLEKQSKYLAT